MTSIPQELIAAIVERVDDTAALKACSLTSPCLRGPSQRVLLRSLALDTSHIQRHAALSALLTESPHIATYVSKLVLRVSFSDKRTVGSLQDVLARFTNVRRCTIAGEYSTERWDPVSPLCPTLLDFIQRQPLTELHLFFLQSIPIPAFALFVSSAPTVTFYYAVVSAKDQCDDPPKKVTREKSMTQLLLSDHAETICDALARAPEHIRSLRKLKICPQHDYSTMLISSAAQTLEHLRIDCSLLINRRSALPPLPLLEVLRCVDLVIPSMHWNDSWLTDTLRTFFASAPPFAQRNQDRRLYDHTLSASAGAAVLVARYARGARRFDHGRCSSLRTLFAIFTSI
ncbi:hypothetical protein MSAN_02504300 [Mycena sanguinolenta]|uniref:F-box domain-containing protein n=1 Tax=Mycena sanguinolenta TaxID=230812 RepID=A0A8H6U174_9AGAR|nr:hypothetical protein MSAN_02504300 [Mycena sanguinolenta]